MLPLVRYPDSDIIVVDARFNKYKIGNAAVERLYTGMRWAEGPAWNAAGRYLVWSDIIRYQEQGLRYFDFGGWYRGTTDQALLKINEFKRGFGGQVMREYRCEKILTLKGWLVLHVAKLLKLAKLFPSRPKGSTVNTQTEFAPGNVSVTTG